MPVRDELKRIRTYVGADGRTLYFAAKTSAGAAYDLTSLTVTITAERNGTTIMSGVACTVSNPAGGLFNVTPTAAQLAAAGDMKATVKLVNGSSKVDFLEPFIIEVVDPVA